MTTSRTLNYAAMVKAADPDYDKESRQPVVYRFSRNIEKRDPNPLYGTGTS